MPNRTFFLNNKKKPKQVLWCYYTEDTVLPSPTGIAAQEAIVVPPNRLGGKSNSRGHSAAATDTGGYSSYDSNDDDDGGGWEYAEGEEGEDDYLTGEGGDGANWFGHVGGDL